MAWLQALREPEIALAWSLPEWERVVRLARRLRLLARLAESLDAPALRERVPAPARRLLLAEQRVSQWRGAAMRWAIERVGLALDGAVYPRVLLKGAAYLGQALPIAHGRMPSDLDILVPKAALADAQRRLSAEGWGEAPLSAYDQRYYREWAHEAPPMRHPTMGMELDVHHGILPPVARTTVDTDALLARLRPSLLPGWQVLDATDQVLHSAAHLFLDSELRDRLRDIVDLDGLLRHHGAAPGFWAALPLRARELGLDEPLALACHFTRAWLGTPIPPEVLDAVAATGPSPLRRAWLLPLLSKVLTPTEPGALPARGQGLAATAVLARYHRQRMPLTLLLPHLWHKLRASDTPDEAQAEPQPR